MLVLILLAVSYLPLQCGCLPLTPWGSPQQLQNPEDLLCPVCLEIVQFLEDAVESNASFDDILPYLEKACVLVVDLDVIGYYGPYYCPAFLKSYIPVLMYVIAHRELDPHEVCQQLHICKTTRSDGMASRDLSILQHLRRIVGNLGRATESRTDAEPVRSRFQTRMEDTARVRKKVSQAKVGQSRKGKEGSTITFLHLADIHLDRQYAEGSPTHCNLYMCCRWWYNGTGSAGHYGSYECDLPMVTLDLLVETIKMMDPQPDFIIYTGDIPPHDYWNNTQNILLNDTHFVIDYLAEKLNITIYPAMGNHESWPETEYMAPLPQYQALNRKLSVYWQKWVKLSSEAEATIQHGAYYSVNIRQGLRVLSFNSYYGMTFNFYTFLNGDNQVYHDQHQWMMDQLAQAKEAGEKVLIIAHVPPGEFYNMPDCGEFYLNLTKNYKDTIVGHFFGHTHMDQFQLIQDEEGLYGVVLIAPSVTPFTYINPSFRVFTMDASSFQLQEYQQYHLNLTKANDFAAQGLKPTFELSYTTSDVYGMKNLTPQSWATLAERFKDNNTVLNEYHYNVRGKSRVSDQTCDDLCKRETLCYVTNIISSDFLECLV